MEFRKYRRIKDSVLQDDDAPLDEGEKNAVEQPQLLLWKTILNQSRQASCLHYALFNFFQNPWWLSVIPHFWLKPCSESRNMGGGELTVLLTNPLLCSLGPSHLIFKLVAENRLNKERKQMKTLNSPQQTLSAQRTKTLLFFGCVFSSCALCFSCNSATLKTKCEWTRAASSSCLPPSLPVKSHCPHLSVLL